MKRIASVGADCGLAALPAVSILAHSLRSIGVGVGAPTPPVLQKHLHTIDPLRERARVEQGQRYLREREEQQRHRQRQQQQQKHRGSNKSGSRSDGNDMAAANKNISKAGSPSSSAAAAPSSSFAPYWQWLEAHGVEHSPLAIMSDVGTTSSNSSGGLRGLYAGADMAAGAVVATVPFRCCLSPSTFPPSVAMAHLNVPTPQYIFEAMNRRRIPSRLIVVGGGANTKQQTAEAGEGGVGIAKRRRYRRIPARYVPVAPEDRTSFLEAQHMWLACVIAAIKHRTAARAAKKAAAAATAAANSGTTVDADDAVNSGDSDGPPLPFETLISMFPTSTADFSSGVKSAWPALSTAEKRDFMEIADGHEASVAKLHAVWLRWVRRVGRDVLADEEESLNNARASNEGGGDEEGESGSDDSGFDDDGEAELVANKEGDVMSTLLGPAKDRQPQQQMGTPRRPQQQQQQQLSVAEQVTCTLTELRWAQRMVLSRATLVPSLCEPSAPEDIGTFLARHEQQGEEGLGDEEGIGMEMGEGNVEGRAAAPVTSVPCIIPLIDLINHSSASSSNGSADKKSSQQKGGSSTARLFGPPNCEVLTARRAAPAADMDSIPMGVLAMAAERDERARSDDGKGAAGKRGDGNGEASHSTDLRLPEGTVHVSRPAEVDEGLVDRGVVVLMAVAPIPKGAPVLVEYDLSDRAASLMRYGFVE